jgi:hypothetical protein
MTLAKSKRITKRYRELIDQLDNATEECNHFFTCVSTHFGPAKMRYLKKYKNAVQKKREIRKKLFAHVGKDLLFFHTTECLRVIFHGN